MRRGAAVGIAAAIVTLGLIGAALAASLHPAYLEGYVEEGSTLRMSACLGSDEAVAWARTTEEGGRVVVDVRAITVLPPGVPRNAALTCDVVDIELGAPLLDRVVVVPDGTELQPLP